MWLFSACIPTHDTVRYDDVKDSLDTGDIILFCGDAMSSRWVQFATFSPWSHVGMVVRCPHFEKNTYANGAKSSDGELYLWHSYKTQLAIPDILTGQTKLGVQLNNLRPALSRYSGQMFVRKLRMKEGRNPMHCTEEFHKFLRDEAPKPYTQELKELFLATYDGPFGENTDQFDTYFCSKLLAYTLMKFGLLQTNIPSSEYTPKDFASFDHLPLENCMYEDEFRLNMRRR